MKPAFSRILISFRARAADGYEAMQSAAEKLFRATEKRQKGSVPRFRRSFLACRGEPVEGPGRITDARRQRRLQHFAQRMEVVF